jgi:hypothetical protein
MRRLARRHRPVQFRQSSATRWKPARPAFSPPLLPIPRCRIAATICPPPSELHSLTLFATPRLVIANADKGLGPLVLEETEYSRLAMTLLEDASVYTRLEDDDFPDLAGLCSRIRSWTIQLGKHGRRISASEEKLLSRPPPAYLDIPAFKILIKLHKSPIAPRPIVPCRGSVTEHVARWLSAKLGTISEQQSTAVSSTTQVLRRIEALNAAGSLPPKFA